MNNQFPFYQLQVRQILKSSPVFKIKKLNEDHVLFGVPDDNCIIAMDNDLNKITQKYQFKDKPLSIQVVEIQNKKYIVGGCQNGQIHIQPQTLEYPKPKYEWILRPKYKNEVFINDIVSIDSSIIANCYNNGNVALWGLTSGKRLHTFQNLHQKYTYKLRKSSDNKMISCGADKMVYRTDLQKLRVVSAYSHPQPVWCSSEVDENSIASVGLMGKILIWDVRVGRVIQTSRTQGIQTSFIVAKNKDKLLFGDMNCLSSCDRRKMQCKIISNQMMLVSIEGILVSGNDLFVCGRGSDVCKFHTCAQEYSMNIIEQMNRSKVLDVKKFKKQPNQEQGQQIEQKQEESEMEDQSQSLIKQKKEKEEPVKKKQDILNLSAPQQLKYEKIQQKKIEISILRYGEPSPEDQMEAQEIQGQEISQDSDDDDQWVQQDHPFEEIIQNNLQIPNQALNQEEMEMLNQINDMEQFDEDQSEDDEQIF